MRRFLFTEKHYAAGIAAMFIFCWVGFLYRLTLPRHGMETRGPAIWLEVLFLLVLYAYVLLAAYGVGQFAWRFFALELTVQETNVLALLIGLGVLSLGVMLLGLIGWLNRTAILIWLATYGVVGYWQLWNRAKDSRWQGRSGGPGSPRSHFEVLLQLVILASVPLLLIGALTPVWDYDALLYHMEIPRQFLAEGRIYFEPDTWRSAYPFFGEMPFLVGMALGLDAFAKLVNLTYAVLLLASIYLFGLRFLGRQVALAAVAIVIGMPAFHLWATWAAVDFAWAVYEFWSIYALLVWLSGDRQTRSKWLMLAGIMSGAAASIKYLALPTLGCVLLLIAGLSLQARPRSWKNVLHSLLSFGLPALAVMGAWYLKNWLWTGNPVYPLLLGGPGWEPVEAQIVNDYVQTFGVGKTWMDYLLLPYNVYARQDHFSTIPIEFIHPALWLSVFFPLVASSSRNLKTVALYTAVYFIIWITTSQVVRFLLPLSAFAALLAAAVIERTPPLLRNVLKVGLLGGLMILSFIYQIGTIQRTGAWGYVTGQMSAAELLRRTNSNIAAVEFIQRSVAPEGRVLFLWDGRGYYCDQRCIPDDEQSTAIRLSMDSPDPERLANDLRQSGVTHVLLSTSDASWFIAYHDPRGWHQDARDYFTNVFFPACGRTVYREAGTELFEIRCR